MKKIKILLFPLLFLTSFYCGGQTVLLKYKEATEPLYDKGPNQKKFVQGFIKFGFVTPPDKDNAKIIYGKSVNIGFGLKKKFKVSPIYSLGWQLEFDYMVYKLKNEPANTAPVGAEIDLKRFDVYSIRLGWFNRFNFDPHRGNFLGTYLDLGIDGAFAYTMKEVYKYDTGYGKAVTKVDNLDYINSFQSEVFAKLGYSRISFWAKYRLTDLLEKDSGKPELPRISAGIELGIY